MRIAKYIGITCYTVIILVTTFFLFTFNQFSDSEIGSTTIVGLSEKCGNMRAGSLLIGKKEIAAVQKGDKIVYYNTENGRHKVDITQVEGVMKTNEKEYTYVIHDGLFLSSEYLIGEVDQVRSIPFLGYLYRILTSKLGYFLLIMLPIMIVFITLVRKYGKSLNHAKNQN